MNRRIFVLVFLASFFSLSSNARDSKNGFDVGNASIPVREILSGGPPKDGIPAIDRPRFVGAHEANFLSGDDRVIGIVLHDRAKAYPIAILNWHEIVNDQIGPQPIVVTYCPLCGTGMVFAAPRHMDFGVSGLLYNSDVLLYDRQSGSLWSQIKMEAISGRRLGEKLELLPASHTTWSDWQTRNPRTQVLSERTGVRRDYDRNPYEGYGKSRELFFPASSRDNRYHPKEQVIGVKVGEQAWVWPFAELAKSSGVLEDEIAGQKVVVRYNGEARSGGVFSEDGKEIPSTIAYWFAWMSFYPASEVYRAP